MQLSSLGGLKCRLQVWLVAVLLITLLPVSVMAEDIAGSGNYEAGKALFIGERSFENGGPPCISCHSAGIGALDGGSLGPNLTKVWEDKFYLIDPEWINGPDTPVMGPVFSRHNLLPEEVEDLKAFFSVQATKSPASAGFKFVGGGIIGFIAIVIFFSIVWSGRFRNRCQGTAHDALWRNYAGKGGK